MVSSLISLEQKPILFDLDNLLYHKWYSKIGNSIKFVEMWKLTYSFILLISFYHADFQSKEYVWMYVCQKFKIILLLLFTPICKWF